MRIRNRLSIGQNDYLDVEMLWIDRQVKEA